MNLVTRSGAVFASDLNRAGDEDGVVHDGLLVIADEPFTVRGANVTIRNCVVLVDNPEGGIIVEGANARVENNRVEEAPWA